MRVRIDNGRPRAGEDNVPVYATDGCLQDVRHSLAKL